RVASILVCLESGDDSVRRVVPDTAGYDQAVLVFFFQAEDGIRDATVTGVQTCALPIYFIGQYPVWDGVSKRQFGRWHGVRRQHRSEERRVGKECGSRWAPQY